MAVFFHLICDLNHEEQIKNELFSLEINFDSRNYDIALVEKGCKAPDDTLCLYFTLKQLKKLKDVLSTIVHDKGITPKKDIITVKDDESIRIIQIDDILYFYSDNNKNFCQLSSQYYEISKRLYEIEKNLFDQGFIRVSKTHIVNIMKIREIQPWFGSRLLLKFHDFPEEVEVSRRYAAHFRDYISM